MFFISRRLLMLLILPAIVLALAACGDDDPPAGPEGPDPIRLTTVDLVAQRAALDLVDQINTLLGNVPTWSEGFEDAALGGPERSPLWALSDPVFADGWWSWETTLNQSNGDITGTLDLSFRVQFLSEGVPQREAAGADEMAVEIDWISDLTQQTDGSVFAMYGENSIELEVTLDSPGFTITGGGSLDGTMDFTGEEESSSYAHTGTWELTLSMAGADLCPDATLNVILSVESDGVTKGPYELAVEYPSTTGVATWELILDEVVLDDGERALLNCTPTPN